MSLWLTSQLHCNFFVTENRSSHWDLFFPTNLHWDLYVPACVMIESMCNILTNSYSSHGYLELLFSELPNSVIQQDYPCFPLTSNDISYCYFLVHTIPATLFLLLIFWLQQTYYHQMNFALFFLTSAGNALLPNIYILSLPYSAFCSNVT